MKLRKHILFVLIFILVQGLTFAVTWYGFGFRYGSAQEARFSVISEAILALMVLYYIRRHASWRAAGYGVFNGRALWMAPMLLPALLYGGYLFSTIAAARPSGLVLLGVATVTLMTLLVGFVEETAFRGILLRGELAAGRNVFVALLISTIGFSLLHSVNVFAGMAPAEMLGQLLDTLEIGLCLAPLALLAGNLIPLVIWHFLWDFSKLVLTQVPLDRSNALFQSLHLAVTPLLYVMGVVGWIAVIVLWRRGAFSKA